MPADFTFQRGFTACDYGPLHAQLARGCPLIGTNAPRGGGVCTDPSLKGGPDQQAKDRPAVVAAAIRRSAMI